MPSRKTMKAEEDKLNSVGADAKDVSATYKRKIDKSKIPTCKILGVNISAINMNWLLKFTEDNIEKLQGDYMTVVNVYCVKIAYKMGLRSICYAHMG